LPIDLKNIEVITLNSGIEKAKDKMAKAKNPKTPDNNIFKNQLQLLKSNEPI